MAEVNGLVNQWNGKAKKKKKTVEIAAFVAKFSFTFIHFGVAIECGRFARICGKKACIWIIGMPIFALVFHIAVPN